MNDWAGDTPPSLPAHLTKAKRVSFGGGFCWTEDGICHDLSYVEVETMRVPPFAPVYPKGR